MTADTAESMAKPYKSFDKTFSKVFREPAAKRRSPVATGEIFSLRKRKDNLNFGRKAPKIWGVFSVKKFNLILFQ